MNESYLLTLDTIAKMAKADWGADLTLYSDPDFDAEMLDALYCDIRSEDWPETLSELFEQFHDGQLPGLEPKLVSLAYARAMITEELRGSVGLAHMHAIDALAALDPPQTEDAAA